MPEENERTPEEREQQRQIAKGHAKGLNAFYAMAHANDGRSYGEIGADATYEFGFTPALLDAGNANALQKIYANSLINSREQGKRLSGSVKEEELTNMAAITVQRALENMTVGDLYELMGVEDEDKGEFYENNKDKFVGDLPDQEKKKLKGIYAEDMTMGVVGKSLLEQRKASQGGLEAFLSGTEKPRE